MRTRLKITLGTALSAFILPQAAFSQTTESDSQPAVEQSTGIADIVVTARRRNESIQDTPIAITALSGNALESRQATSLISMNTLAPALTINSSAAFSGSSQTVAIFMRGIGQTDFTLNTDPGVGIYVDGVYISRSVGALLDLVDVDRLEVLRGPQGTLFGRNSIGGAISITTKRPAAELGGKVSLTYGSDNLLIANASIDVPLSSDVLTKFTVQSSTRDGYVRRLSDGLRFGNKDNLSARFGLLWTPSPSTEILLNADYSRSREHGTPLVLTDINPNAAFPAAYNIVVAPQLNPALAGIPGGCASPQGAAVGGTSCYNSQWILGDRFATASTYPSYSDADVWGASLTLTQKLSDSFTLKSISAYRDLDSRFARDSDGSPLPVAATEDIFKYHQFSQEVQLSADLLDSRLNAIVGGYYFNEKGVNPNIVDVGFVRFQSGGRVRNTSAAAFGQATYKITDQFSLTAGLRYTKEKKRFTPDEFVISGYTVPFFPPFLQFTPGQRLTTSLPQTAKANELTPHLSLAYRPNQDMMFYVSYSRGFKSGGFTQRIFPALPQPPSFAPETVSVYETGFKLDLADRRLRLNGAAYYTDYSDLQVTVPVGVAPTTQNAAKARIKGFELEATAIPVDGLTGTFSVGYVDAYYLSLDARVSPTLQLGNSFPGTSKWTLNGTLSYEAELGNGLTLTPLVGWSYRSSFSFDAENFVGQRGYHLFDASITLANAEKGWTASLFGKNLTDKYYSLHGEQILDPAGFRFISPARGAEWGLRVTKSF